MPKKISFEFEGKKRVFVLKNRTFDVIAKVTGFEDPMNQFVLTGQTYKDIRAYAKTILYAGLVAALDRDEEPDFTQEDVDRWLEEELDPAEIYDIVMKYATYRNPKISANGEGDADTRAQAAVVAAD